MAEEHHIVQDLQEAAHHTADRSHYVNEWVMHHVTDSGEWHTPLFNLHLPAWITNNAIMLIIASLLLIFTFGFFYRYQKAAVPDFFLLHPDPEPDGAVPAVFHGDRKH